MHFTLELVCLEKERNKIIRYFNKLIIPSGSIVRVVTDDYCVITRAPSEYTTVTDLVLDIADDSTFWDGSEREHISYNEGGLLTAVHKLPGVHAFGGNEELLLVLVAERVAESDACKRGASTRVMNHLAHYTLEVPIALAEIQ